MSALTSVLLEACHVCPASWSMEDLLAQKSEGLSRFLGRTWTNVTSQGECSAQSARKVVCGQSGGIKVI